MLFDCLVIGSGIAGLFTARALAAAGVKTALVGPPDDKASSSWAAGGILAPLQPWLEPAAARPLTDWAQAAYDDLAAKAGFQAAIGTSYAKSGMLMLEPEDRELIQQWSNQFAVPVAWLDSDDLVQRESALATGIKSAAYLPGVAQIRNPRLLRVLQAGLRQQQVSLIAGNVQRLVCENRRCHGVMVAGELIRSKIVVLAAGAWSSQLLPVGDPVADQLYPVRGQMIAYQLATSPIQSIIWRSGRYLIPRADCVLLAGSTLEDVGFDTSVTQSARTELQAFVGGLLPELRERQPDWHWSGLRPASTDGLPLIGPHPEIDGLYLNTGHYRNGILLAPASARLLADQLLGRQSFCSEQPYLPARFLNKQ